MYPDAHLYIHRTEQAARSRAGSHPAPRTVSRARRDRRRRTAAGASLLAGQRLALLRR